MSIYQRDNINYQSMIDNMIRNRIESAKLRSDNIRRQAEIKSQFAKDLASTVGKGLDYYQAYSESGDLDNQLKDLEEQRAQLVREQSAYEQYKNSPAFRGITNPNRSYNTNEWMVNANPDNYYELESNPQFNANFTREEQWLMDHPGKTHADYLAYAQYMNGVYGGR